MKPLKLILFQVGCKVFLMSPPKPIVVFATKLYMLTDSAFCNILALSGIPN